MKSWTTKLSNKFEPPNIFTWKLQNCIQSEKKASKKLRHIKLLFSVLNEKAIAYIIKVYYSFYSFITVFGITIQG